ncbi:diguanylate phosphodiesterase [Photobacterium kishitanii]|uniref:Diguanylate phosphodiesterase n=1 Tax=Photobacterium kishitanii TaxID=318456 RepID=A0AAX0Z091_9GAMM|nr:EAL domain-containing protein [Photobacterium kishitanii]KJG57915.1 diguanylate phosphodiesterase [Photobacterium kishitanii]KJG61491.1 diguanylate phosphodiesterase [Photobacterium kishitanii]OBU29580.1 diguanylate phosphodiesterase [Photobacterium kishitanii]PSV07759.1 diguanylate phosphodiesterase [Photobacterium kishitanii]PSV76247.1 diguanylate phosphodiesterase [Photobacterium kishitanii]
MPMFKKMSYLSANKYLVAVSNVFLMALPLVLISTFCELVAVVCDHFNFNDLGQTVHYVGQTTGIMIPILVNFYLATYLSAVKCIPKGTVIATSLTVFFIVSYQWNLISPLIPLPNNFPISLLTAYVSCEIIAKLKNIRVFKIKSDDSFIDISMSMLAGSIATISMVLSISFLFRKIFEQASTLISWSLIPRLDPTSFFDGLIYEVLRGLLWSIGINGHNILHTYKTELYNVTMVNITEWHNFGADLNILSTNFYDFFTGIGGSGNMLSLALCMLFFAKSKGYKILAKAALLLCLFNVNEPILYGVPIIFNPVMIIPFLLVPAVSFVIAYGAIYIGIVPHLTEVHSWLMPPIISGYVATGGSIAGAILQLLLIVLGIVIYLPFFRLMDKRSLGIGVSDIFSNRLFTSDEIEVKTRLTSFIPSLHNNLTAQREIEKLQTEGEFILYFQPQVDIKNNKVSGCEVLIRFRNHQGQILPPTFIPAFNQLGLMPELDLWVLDKAIKAAERFIVVNPNFKLSINISPDTVLSKNFVNTLKNRIIDSSLSFCHIELEFTEELLILDEAKVTQVMSQLQHLGISVALDDFGTGYSSLAYLSRFEFNKVKIDRSLVLNLDSQRGKELFKIAVQLGKITQADIVVEGVEQQAELDFIASLGVRYIQGFYFYKPMAEDELFQRGLLTSQQCEAVDN